MTREVFRVQEAKILRRVEGLVFNREARFLRNWALESIKPLKFGR